MSPKMSTDQRYQGLQQHKGNKSSPMFLAFDPNAFAMGGYSLKIPFYSCTPFLHLNLNYADALKTIVQLVEVM